MPESMAEECMEEVWPLMNLYVGLHNRFVLPYYGADERDYQTHVWEATE